MTHSFKKDATGYMVVNLSNGPSVYPVLHESPLSACKEAARLAEAQPGDTFQAFKSVPVPEVYRYETVEGHRAVYKCGGRYVVSQPYSSRWLLRNEMKYLGFEVITMFTTKEVDNVSTSS